MRILAQKGDGDDPTMFLLVRDGVTDLREEDGRVEGRVLDMDYGLLFPWFNAHSILARGYWHPFEGDQAILDDLLADAERVDLGGRSLDES